MARGRNTTVGWVRGIDDLRAALRGIPQDIATEVLEEGVRAACQPILEAARQFAERSEDTGALKASLTMKTKAYPNNGKAVGLVGPDRAYFVAGRKVGPLGALHGGARRPANYAHLVEYGHRIALGGSLRPQYTLNLVETGGYSKNGKPLKRWKRGSIKTRATGRAGGMVAAKPFIRPAVITTRLEQHAAFEAAIAKGLDRRLRKYQRAA